MTESFDRWVGRLLLPAAIQRQLGELSAMWWQRRESRIPFLLTLTCLVVLSVHGPLLWQRVSEKSLHQWVAALRSAPRHGPFARQDQGVTTQPTEPQASTIPLWTELPASASLTVEPRLAVPTPLIAGAPRVILDTVMAYPCERTRVVTSSLDTVEMSPAETQTASHVMSVEVIEETDPAEEEDAHVRDLEIASTECEQSPTADENAPPSGMKAIAEVEEEEVIALVGPTLSLDGPSEPSEATVPQIEISDNRDVSAVEGVYVIVDPETISQRKQAEKKTSADHLWFQPVSLIEQLEPLIWECETGAWAMEVTRLSKRLGEGMVAGPDQADEILNALHELGGKADRMLAELEDDHLAGQLRTAQYTLGRRLDIWQKAVSSGGLVATDRTAENGMDRVRLAECIRQIEEMTTGSEAGNQWREYLALDVLKAFADETIPSDGTLGHSAAREILRRLTRAKLSEDQFLFVTTGPVADLAIELQRWVGGPADMVSLMAYLERYELHGLPGDARQVADACRQLEISPSSERQMLAERLKNHYYQSNIRLSVSDDLINRLIPERATERAKVRDRMLGNPVYGNSTTETDVSVLFIPDPTRLRMALKINGQVAADTTAYSGPARIRSRSLSTYTALKEVELTLLGLYHRPVEVSVRNDVRLRSLETDYDSIPLLGALANDIARSQHDKKQGEVRRQLRSKVYWQAKRQIEEETTEQLGVLDQKLRERLLGPLGAMALGPALVVSETTSDRLSVRLRVATDEQLASHTPSPRLPPCEASFQLHQSALNNLVEQVGISGATYTVAELRERIADRLNLPNLREMTTENDDVTITLPSRNAVQVQFEDGRIKLSVSVVRLQKGRRMWKNFRAQVYYKFDVDGGSIRLVRDGTPQLPGTRGAEILLRGIVSKIFHKDRPLNLTPGSQGDGPRLAGIEVNHLVVDDGWISLGLTDGQGRAQVADESQSGAATRRR